MKVKKTFLDYAYEVLLEAKGALHISDITKKALKRGLLTTGKTPELTMYALILREIATEKENSRFSKNGPALFKLNRLHNKKLERKTKTENISKKQKGDLAESFIIDSIIMYAEKELSIYKPISDDEGVDLIVKRKFSDETIFIQVKSKFPRKLKGNRFTAKIEKKFLGKSYKEKLFIVGCYFDREIDQWGDLIWFISFKELEKDHKNKKNSNELKINASYIPNKQSNNKWEKNRISKTELANTILKEMKKIYSKKDKK